MKAFRIAQFSKNSKIQKITVKKFFFQNFDTGFLLIGVFRVYSQSFIAKLAKTKNSISSETNPNIIAKPIGYLYIILARSILDISIVIVRSKYFW